MKIKKIISFLLMLTILFTMNVAPGFADSDKQRTIEIKIEGNGSVEIGKLQGQSFTSENIYSSEGPHTYYRDHNQNVRIIVSDGDFLSFEVTKINHETNDILNTETITDKIIIDISSAHNYKIIANFLKDTGEAKTYTVTGVANPEIGGVVTPSSEVVEKDESVTLTAKANEGYVFVRWEENGSELSDDSDITINENTITISNIARDRTITAIYEPEEQEGPGETTYYTVTTGTIGEGTVTVSVIINDEDAIPDPYEEEDGKTYSGIEPEAKVIIAATPAEGSVFAGWEEYPDEKSNIYEISSIGDNYALTAIYEPEEQEGPGETTYYTVITDTSGEGTVTVSVIINDEDATPDPYEEEDGKTYSGIEPEAKVIITATPAEGSVFAGWEEYPDEKSNIYEISSIGDNYTLTAIFEPENSDDGGNQDNPDGPADPGNEPPPSNPGSSTAYYTLTVEVEGPGSVSPTGGSYARGRTISLNPTADEGAQFVGWFGRDGDDVSDTNRILMNGSKSIIARFEAIPAEEEEFIDEDIPESGDIVEVPEETIPDEYVPQAGETLPQTGGIPMELLFGVGFALIGGGVSLNKKEEKKTRNNE